eukprot:5353117-Pleurochrysis_carterae.AAC.1
MTSSHYTRTTAPAPSTLVSSRLSRADGMSRTKVRCRTSSTSTSPLTVIHSDRSRFDYLGTL